jgi:hypothetical protein
MVFSVSGNQLVVSWPSDHVGWTLQVQTNDFRGVWFDVLGSASTNQVYLPIDPANKDVFYRMILH